MEHTTTVPVRVTRDQLLALDHISKHDGVPIQEVAEAVMALGLKEFAREEEHYDV